MLIAGLVVAAGRGIRLGGETPKQYQRLGASTLLRESLLALTGHPGVDQVFTVIHSDDRALYDLAVADAPGIGDAVAGGPTRTDSVRLGLEALAAHPPDRVLIHDAARPFLPRGVIDNLLAALDSAPAAVPALPVADALWHEADGCADTAVDRTGLWRAQTPQAFRFPEILAAHRGYKGVADDDVAVARAAGLPVAIVPGSELNFKITTPDDLVRAQRHVAGGTMDIRTGNGFDVHAFGPGDRVVLCGVEIPFDRGLTGHSDADVAMHAVTDALLGALAEGDIGRWFPPSDPQWQGAASRIFLQKAVERAGARGFEIGHLDCTIVCEAPRIGPYAEIMRERMAALTGLATDRVSIKATTSERLGFTGRGEGIAAFATATLSRR